MATRHARKLPFSSIVIPSLLFSPPPLSVHLSSSLAQSLSVPGFICSGIMWLSIYLWGKACSEQVAAFLTSHRHRQKYIHAYMHSTPCQSINVRIRAHKAHKHMVHGALNCGKRDKLCIHGYWIWTDSLKLKCAVL